MIRGVYYLLPQHPGLVADRGTFGYLFGETEIFAP